MEEIKNFIYIFAALFTVFFTYTKIKKNSSRSRDSLIKDLEVLDKLDNDYAYKERVQKHIDKSIKLIYMPTKFHSKPDLIAGSVLSVIGLFILFYWLPENSFGLILFGIILLSSGAYQINISTDEMQLEERKKYWANIFKEKI